MWFILKLNATAKLIILASQHKFQFECMYTPHYTAIRLGVALHIYLDFRNI